MAMITPLEIERGHLWLLRPDVFSIMTKHMALFEQRTGRKTTVPADGGYRDYDRQAQLYADSLDAAGNVKPGYRATAPGASPHEVGAAYHLQIVGATDQDPLYKTLGDIGRELGMRAGVYFSGTPDPEHFETDETQAVRARLWRELVGRRLRRAVGVGVAVVGVGLGLWWWWRRMTSANSSNARADD